MIVAYHFVVNSGLSDQIQNAPTSLKSIFLLLFGAWGKVGINCFLMITGYYMCTSRITLRKFVKMMAQIYFFKFVLFVPLYLIGYESLTMVRLLKLLTPVSGLGTSNFVGCFIVFWLTIPFLNILIRNMTKRQHELLILLSLLVYTVCGTIPHFDVPLNYITWFGIVYFIASYIRLYPNSVFDRKTMWGWLTIMSVALALLSIVGMQYLFGKTMGRPAAHFFIVDCNKVFAVAVAVSSFLWFKNMKIRYSKVINAIGASTFGVLLIHANSDAMRQWLWYDLINCIGHYSLSLGSLVLYSLGVVLAIFVVCSILDQLRCKFLEIPFLRWYDNHSFDERLKKAIE